MNFSISPIKNKLSNQSPWEGDCPIKPWDYQITAVVPVLDTLDTLQLCIELLRLQTVRPFIVVIDTGSSQETLDQICSLRSVDLEVHTIRLNGVQHPSDYPAIAMDLAFSLCRTPYLFATHSDCFIKRRDFLQDLLLLVQTKSPVVGYEITPRSHEDWKGMVSHTATMYHMETIDKIGFGWSLRRLCNIYDIKDYKPDPARPNWPDTEILGNYILRHFKIEPHLIGHEQNFKRFTDDNIDHCRSLTAGRLYSPFWQKHSEEWLIPAMKEAQERIEEWKKEIVELKNKKKDE